MTVKSVIEIDVKDEAFKQFAERFEKYRDAVKKLPGAWGGVDEKVSHTSGQFVEMTAAILAQLEILKHSGAQHEKVRDTVGTTAKGWKAMARDSKEFSLNIAHATTNLLRWVSLTTVFSGLAGAGGLYGFDRLGHATFGAARAAGGLGVTTGQQKAFGLNYGGLVDADANLARVTDAKSDIRKRAAFAQMGITGVDDKDPAQLAVEMAERARTLYKRDPSAVGAQVSGLDQFYSMDELRRLGSASDDDMAKHRQGYGRDVGSLSVGGDTLKAWTDFSQQMSRAGEKIEATFVRGLAPLTPGLERLSDAFAESVKTFLESDNLKRWFEEAGDGIKTFARYVASPGFQKDVSSLATGVAALAHGVAKGLYWLHLTDTDPDASGPQAGSAGAPGGTSGAPGGGQAPTRERANIMTELMKYGWTKAQASGIAANIAAESGGDYRATGDGGKAYGLAQWHPERQAAFAKWAGHDIRQSSYDEQLAFINHELRSGARRFVGDELSRTNDPDAAGRLVSRKYESPNDPGGAKAAQRGSVAVTIFNNTGGSAIVTSNQVAQ